MQTDKLMKQDLSVAAYKQDPLSAVYVLRAVALKPGAKMTMPVSDSGRNYKVQLTIGNRELVRTGIGNVNAWRVTPVVTNDRGQVEGRKMTIWISDDARKLPVKMEAELAVGTFNLTLRQAQGS
jgi:hypothetical protein